MLPQQFRRLEWKPSRHADREWSLTPARKGCHETSSNAPGAAVRIWLVFDGSVPPNSLLRTPELRGNSILSRRYGWAEACTLSVTELTWWLIFIGSCP